VDFYFFFLVLQCFMPLFCTR